ncbi:16S rRNA (uracil(1498)-N(3))-methyltransferase [Acetobacteraceae bacterium]|nr:16S rRNA (uracil(1498)-N(3))-methyltransferase [Acetobacteraceae bacterium]
MKEISSPHLLQRLFLDSEENGSFPSLKAGISLLLSKEHTHYLGNVLRRRIGDYIRLFNGKDGEWLAKISSLTRRETSVEVVKCLRSQQPLKKQKQLLFSPLKRDATELVIRMGTELGVSRFRPLVMARTNLRQLNEKRLKMIAIEASEQSERLDIPEILPITPMCTTLAQWHENMPIAVAMERESALPRKLEKKIDTVLVGPEGGFSEEEKEQILKCHFCHPFSLGEQILRADTAIVAALTSLEINF